MTYLQYSVLPRNQKNYLAERRVHQRQFKIMETLVGQVRVKPAALQPDGLVLLVQRPVDISSPLQQSILQVVVRHHGEGTARIADGDLDLLALVFRLEINNIYENQTRKITTI